jgi:hypothetical protein
MVNKMKVGILTFHRAHNYGAALQAYALQQKIDSLGHDPLIVDYRPTYIENQYRYFSLIPRRRKRLTGNAVLQHLLLSAYNLDVSVRKKRHFGAFAKECFRLSPPMEHGAGGLVDVDIDACVCGSDQIWNPSITGGLDPVFFGLFPASKPFRRVSYGASIGWAEIGSAHEERLTALLEGMDWVSVREDRAKALVERCTTRPVHHVLDPCLLLDRDQWDCVAATPQLHESYLLVYQVIRYPEVSEIARQIAARLGLRIVEIAYTRSRHSGGMLQVLGCGPREFLGYFRNAAFVVTNSFHGTAFSIIYRKNFYVVPHKTVGSRMASLMNALRLSERLVHDLAEIDPLAETDYERVIPLLEIHKKWSEQFLTKALAAPGYPQQEGAAS